MRRFLTFALGAGLAALVALAAVDALRSGGTQSRPDEAPQAETAPPAAAAAATTEAAAPPGWIGSVGGLADGLRRERIAGTLYLSADGCLDGRPRRLRVLALPDLTLSEGPAAQSCSFTLSADGNETGGPETVWSPQAPVLAAQTGPGSFEVIDVRHAHRLRLPGSAPSFAPDGDLVHVRGGRVVRWSNDCATAPVIISPPISFGPEQVGPYCSRTAVTRNEVARALPRGDRLESVDALAWADDSRLLAVLRTDEGSWLAAFEDGKSLGYGNGFVFRVEAPPKVDPTGRYMALSPGGYLEVYDRNAARAWGSSVRTTAYDWSSDGEWLAYADAGNVYLARTSDWTTRYSITVSTQSLAWRG
jgi:hypothetical protein